MYVQCMFILSLGTFIVFFEAGLNLSIILKIKYNSFRDFCQLLIDEKRRKT